MAKSVHNFIFQCIRDIMKFMERFLAGKKKWELLSYYGWYRNMHGGWTHPHAIDYMTFGEIWKLTPKQLKYKLKHGSEAILPKE